MKLSNFARFALLFFIVLAFVGLSAPVDAQNQDLYWQFIDSDITIRPNGDVRIQETWQVVFTSGSFHFGTRYFDTSKLGGITDIAISEGNRVYTQSKNQSEYSFETLSESAKFTIKWYFPYTSNSTHTYIVSYTVKDVVRIYEGGDQIWWDAIFPEHGFPVRSSTVTVHLPSNFDSTQIKAAITTGTGDTQIANGQTVVFKSQNIPANQKLEVRVQFPHGVVTAAPPVWQATADAEAAAKAEAEKYKPIFNLGFIFAGLVLLLLGPLGVFLLWYTKGRDPATPMIAQTSAPPSNLPPGAVGTLIDEKADMSDIIATIVDLARRGIIKMTEKEEAGFLGIGKTRDFVFELVGDTSGLRKYENTLIDKVFSGGSSRSLSDLKNQFYTAIPILQKEMYNDVTQAGFFSGNPNSVRAKYTGLGCAALILFGGIGFCLFTLLSEFADFAICPAISLVLTGVGLMVIGPFMPRRSLKGATERQKWIAFKRYLESIEKFTNLEQAKELFDKYLPYAIAFGLEKSWVQKFAAIGTPAPTWYETYPPIYGRPHFPNQPSQSDSVLGEMGSSGGGVGRSGGMPSLDSAAGGTFRGLDSISSGLFSMLNTTSSTFTSAPSSSGSSGGGWSGGGGGGGGGSGGGGGGFG